MKLKKAKEDGEDGVRNNYQHKIQVDHWYFVQTIIENVLPDYDALLSLFNDPLEICFVDFNSVISDPLTKQQNLLEIRNHGNTD